MSNLYTNTLQNSMGGFWSTSWARLYCLRERMTQRAARLTDAGPSIIWDYAFSVIILYTVEECFPLKQRAMKIGVVGLLSSFMSYYERLEQLACNLYSLRLTMSNLGWAIICVFHHHRESSGLGVYIDVIYVSRCGTRQPHPNWSTSPELSSSCSSGSWGS